MILIPAIDLHDGKCVQLQRGELSTATTYGADAGELAKHWISQGARKIHVVDLDGAFQGHSVNVLSVEKVLSSVENVPIELGGGIRSLADIEYWLSRGVSQVIIGTSAVEDGNFLREATEKYPRQVILGLDALNGFVATRGWRTNTSLTVEQLLEDVEELPLHGIVFTDIDQDGMLSGVNIQANRKVLQQSSQKVIASGGVQNLDDIRRLRSLHGEFPTLIGAISGTALYERSLEFTSAQAIFDA